MENQGPTAVAPLPSGQPHPLLGMQNCIDNNCVDSPPAASTVLGDSVDNCQTESELKSLPAAQQEAVVEQNDQDELKLDQKNQNLDVVVSVIEPLQKEGLALDKPKRQRKKKEPKDYDAITNSGTSPSRASTKSPARGKTQSPSRHSPGTISPGRANNSSPVRTNHNSPARGSNLSPARGSPGRAGNQSPGRSSNHSPGRVSRGPSPGRSAHSPGRGGNSPGRGSRSPGRSTTSSPSRAATPKHDESPNKTATDKAKQNKSKAKEKKNSEQSVDTATTTNKKAKKRKVPEDKIVNVDQEQTVSNKTVSNKTKTVKNLAANSKHKESKEELKKDDNKTGEPTKKKRKKAPKKSKAEEVNAVTNGPVELPDTSVEQLEKSKHKYSRKKKDQTEIVQGSDQKNDALKLDDDNGASGHISAENKLDLGENDIDKSENTTSKKKTTPKKRTKSPKGGKKDKSNSTGTEISSDTKSSNNISETAADAPKEKKPKKSRKKKTDTERENTDTDKQQPNTTQTSKPKKKQSKSKPEISENSALPNAESLSKDNEQTVDYSETIMAVVSGHCDVNITVKPECDFIEKGENQNDGNSENKEPLSSTINEGGSENINIQASQTEESIKDEGTDAKIYQCPKCAYNAKKKISLRRHMTVHGVFECAHCEFVSDKNSVYEEHMKERHPSRCGRKLCKKCNVLFRVDEIDEHEKECTGEKKKWSCSECQKEFKFLCAMKAHELKWHSSSGKSCDQCDFHTGSYQNLKRHINQVHRKTSPPEKKDPIKCPDCDKMFSSDTSIRQHRKAHEGEEHVCQTCQKVFKTSRSLNNHQKVHETSRTVTCDVEDCSKVFKNAKVMEIHKKRCHDKEPKKFKCTHPNCEQMFYTKYHLKRHEIMHTGERNFKCTFPDCSKAFHHAENLKVHFRSHSNVKCPQCRRMFKEESSLKAHLLIHENAKSKKKRKPIGPGQSISNTNQNTTSGDSKDKEVKFSTQVEDSQETTVTQGNEELTQSENTSSAMTGVADNTEGNVSSKSGEEPHDVYDFHDSDDEKVDISAISMRQSPIKAARIKAGELLGSLPLPSAPETMLVHMVQASLECDELAEPVKKKKKTKKKVTVNTNEGVKADSVTDGEKIETKPKAKKKKATKDKNVEEPTSEQVTHEDQTIKEEKPKKKSKKKLKVKDTENKEEEAHEQEPEKVKPKTTKKKATKKKEQITENEDEEKIDSDKEEEPKPKKKRSPKKTKDLAEVTESKKKKPKKKKQVAEKKPDLEEDTIQSVIEQVQESEPDFQADFEEMEDAQPYTAQDSVVEPKPEAIPAVEQEDISPSVAHEDISPPPTPHPAYLDDRKHGFFSPRPEQQPFQYPTSDRHSGENIESTYSDISQCPEIPQEQNQESYPGDTSFHDDPDPDQPLNQDDSGVLESPVSELTEAEVNQLALPSVPGESPGQEHNDNDGHDDFVAGLSPTIKDINGQEDEMLNDIAKQVEAESAIDERENYDTPHSNYSNYNSSIHATPPSNQPPSVAPGSVPPPQEVPVITSHTSHLVEEQGINPMLSRYEGEIDIYHQQPPSNNSTSHQQPSHHYSMVDPHNLPSHSLPQQDYPPHDTPHPPQDYPPHDTPHPPQDYPPHDTPHSVPSQGLEENARTPRSESPPSIPPSNKYYLDNASYPQSVYHRVPSVPPQDTHMVSDMPPTPSSVPSESRYSESMSHPNSLYRQDSQGCSSYNQDTLPPVTTPSYNSPPQNNYLDQPLSLVNSKEDVQLPSGAPERSAGSMYLSNRSSVDAPVSTSETVSVPVTSASSSATPFGADGLPRDLFGQYFQDATGNMPLTHSPMSQEQRGLPSYPSGQQQSSLPSLSTTANAEYFRRASAAPFIPGTGYPGPSVTESLVPPPQHWMSGQDDRSRGHWGQASPILPMPSELESSSPLTRNPYSSSRPTDYSFNSSSSSSQFSKQGESTYPSVTQSIATPSDRPPYDVASAYMSSRAFNPNYPGSMPPPPPSATTQKQLEEVYRRAAQMTDYRTLSQAGPSMADMYSRMAVPPGLGLDKYYYPRDAMFRSQHLSAAANPFMPQTSNPQMAYTDRDYSRNPIYSQHSAYSLMGEKQYLATNKLPPTLPGLQDRAMTAEYLQSPAAMADPHMQDPYRRSVIYNMMSRYF